MLNILLVLSRQQDADENFITSLLIGFLDVSDLLSYTSISFSIPSFFLRVYHFFTFFLTLSLMDITIFYIGHSDI